MQQQNINIITLLVYKMNQGKINNQNGRNSRKKSVSNPVWRRDEISTAEDLNTDIKTYRMFMNRFLQTINTFYVKKHKNFFAEIDQYYRVPLTRQQKQHLQDNLHKVVEKHIDKAKKDMIARNTQAFKKINAYTQEYCKVYGIPEEKPEVQQKKQTQFESPRRIVKYRPRSSCSRPRSGVSQTQRSSAAKQQTKDIFCPSININKQFQKDLIFQFGDTLKFTTRKQINYQQLHVASRTYRIAVNQRSNCNNLGVSTSKILEKSDLLPRPSRKSVNEIDKQKIQTRLFMLNKTLGTTMTSSQGYKPKSKCWGTTIKNQKCFF